MCLQSDGGALVRPVGLGELMIRIVSLVAAIAAAGALVAVIIWQQSRIGHLEAEAAGLRERLELQAEPHGPAGKTAEVVASVGLQSNAAPTLSGEQERELLRLRGEMGVLRRQLAQTLQQAPKEQAEHPPSAHEADTWTEADLNERQRQSLAEWTARLKTGNSVTDIGRLKDSLNRYDELFMKPAPDEQKPVFAVLKEKLKERIAELEAQK